MKRVAVILAGCGHRDGSEIREAVLTLLALDRQGVQYRCFAPDRMQHDVINHLTGEPMSESRNILVEAARIARGDVEDVRRADVGEFDAVIVPGGYGSAKNLCDFALRGADMEIQPDIEHFLSAMHVAGKPVGLICIAPAMAPRIEPKTRFTIGTDAATAKTIEKMGGHHVECAVTECVVDKDQKIVSTPAYMFDARVSKIAEGIDKLVQEVLALA